MDRLALLTQLQHSAEDLAVLEVLELKTDHPEAQAAAARVLEPEELGQLIMVTLAGVHQA
jgi:hypothetical protein